MQSLLRAVQLHVLSFACALTLFVAGASGAQNLRVYFLGNSITHGVNLWNVETLAVSRGHGFSAGEHCHLGRALHQIWEDPNGAEITLPPYDRFQNALTNYRFDAISLQPFSRPIGGATGDRAAIRNFINYALPKSPNAQFYVFSQWPIWYSGTPLDFNERWQRPYSGDWDDSIRTRDFYEKLTLAAREDFPNLAKPVLLVPAGDVLYELNQRMHAGLVPGYSDVGQFYIDEFHFDNVGRYLLSLTYYATLFKEDPRGLPYNTTLIPNPIVAAQMQDAVWRVVSTNPLAGVGPPRPSESIRPVRGDAPLTPVPEPACAAALVLLSVAGAPRRRRVAGPSRVQHGHAEIFRRRD